MDFILDDFCWSYSRIESFYKCPKYFELQYIKCKDSTSGVFGEYGTLIHNCLEKYAKNELSEYELSSWYSDNFDKEIKSPFPPNKFVDLKESYYMQGLEYFDSFMGFGERKILGVEGDYKFKIGKYNFTGKIDLECEDCIIDHKTKKNCHVTRITKSNMLKNWIQLVDGRYVEFENFIQLYVYCIPYFDKYGKYPEMLVLNLARVKEWYEIDFNENDFKRAQKWIINKIDAIYQTTEFSIGEETSMFWCNNVCGQRYNCNNSDRYFELYEE